MGRYEKVLEKIMKTPTANDITPDEIKSFLNHYGFEIKHVNGSHYIYAFKGSTKTFMLNIPMHNPVKPTYIDQVRDRITEIEENE